MLGIAQVLVVFPVQGYGGVEGQAEGVPALGVALNLQILYLEYRPARLLHGGAETDGDQLFVIAAEAHRGADGGGLEGQLAGQAAQGQRV